MFEIFAQQCEIYDFVGLRDVVESAEPSLFGESCCLFGSEESHGVDVDEY